MIPAKKLVALAAAGALFVAACGSDDDESTDTTADTEAPAEEEPADTEAPAEEEPADTEAPAEEEPSGAAFAVDTSACDDPDAATAPFDGDTIKIGTSIPLSGGPAVLFAPFGDGQQAYIEYYNSEFGGIDGIPLEVIVKDDQYTADLTVANVDELIFDDEVDILSGIIGSPNNLAIQEDMNAQCIPQLWASTGAPNWGEVDTNPWTTGLLVAYAVESAAWAEYAAAQGAETTALFYVNNEFGQAYAEAYREAAAENGLEILIEETIDAADSGAPSGQMTNLAEANPDAILAVPLGAQCIAFMTELGNAKAANPDFDPLVYQTATCAAPVFFGAVQNGGNEGVFTSNNLKDVNNPDVVASDENVQAYLDAFAASGSEADPGGIAAAGWLSMELAVHVLEQAAEAGNLSREGVINAARNIDYVATLLRDGCAYQMSAEDGFIGECTQILAWSNETGGFVDQGEVIDLEGSQGVYGG